MDSLCDDLLCIIDSIFFLFICTARSYEGLQNLSKRAGPMYSFETSEKGLLNYNSNCMFTYYGV